MISELTRTISRLLLLPSLIIALAVLVKGYAAVGDGFSAGVIAALGVLLQYIVFGPRETERHLPLHLAPELAAAGVLLALLVAFAPVLFGYPVLTHFPRPGQEVAHFGRIEFHTAVLFDVGVFLLIFGVSIGTIRLIAHSLDQKTE